nr:uncharacterized protein LOC112025522 [Quercus suber]
MKFLLCCGVMRPDRVVKSKEEEEEEEGETTRLAPLAPARRRRRVRRASAGEAEWKPSLCAISEDLVMIEKKKKKEEEEEEEKRRASSERVANSKRKTKTAPSRARVLFRSYSDDYERSHMPTILPTFAPAPFMF